jgi:hypothetical protein
MMLDRLDAAAFNTSAMPAEHRIALEQRMQQAMQEEGRRPDPTPDFDTKPLPPSPEALIDMMVRQWWSGDFMRAMLLGDPDEKLGMKAEPYAD